MIDIKNVSKKYSVGGEPFLALENVSLKISEGEFTSIIGPSGSGKSTLMHLIGLLDRPTSGDILIQGRNIKDLTDDQLSLLRNEFVGFVFQQFNLINKLTILENVLLPTVYTRKRLSFNPKDKGLSILDRFGIKDKAYTYPNKISGGQQQRVAIARSLIMQPSLILADEPTGNLDTKTGNTILDLLKDLNEKEKITIIIVTHEKDVAERARREILIRDGQIASDT